MGCAALQIELRETEIETLIRKGLLKWKRVTTEVRLSKLCMIF